MRVFLMALITNFLTISNSRWSKPKINFKSQVSWKTCCSQKHFSIFQMYFNWAKSNLKPSYFLWSAFPKENCLMWLSHGKAQICAIVIKNRRIIRIKMSLFWENVYRICIEHLSDSIIHGCQQKRRPNIQIINWRYQNQPSTTIGECFNKGQIWNPNEHWDSVVKEAYQKLSKVLRSIVFSLKTKKSFLNCYIISILLSGSEYWTISSQMKKRSESIETWFYKRMLRIHGPSMWATTKF